MRIGGARAIRAGLAFVLLCTAVLSWVIATRLRVDRESVLGDYYAEYDYATEHLVINADGTFSQKISFKNSRETLDNTGMWEYDNIGSHGDSYIVFNGLISIENQDGSIRIPKRASAYMPVYRWPFKAVICCHANEDPLYVKR